MTSKADRIGLRHAPMAFTEQGIAMLSSVLNSERAIRVNIAITVPCEIQATLEKERHSPRGEFERGGGPPLSVGPAGRAPRLPWPLQAREPSPRTKGSGGYAA